VATALLLCTSLAAADAASSAQAASAAAVSSSNWGAVATVSTAPPYGTDPLTVTFSGLLSAPQYFNLVNTGTLPLTAVTIEATTTRGAAAIQACATAWNETLDICPSGAVTVATSGAGPTPYNAPMPTVGSSIRLRASVTSGRNFTMTIGVNVTRAQVRAASVTGS
jgi:hypothetical protein